MEIPQAPGTFNLPGPSTLTYEYLLDLVTSVTLTAPSKAPQVPKAVAMLIANLASKSLWWPILSPDEITRRYIDDATVAGNWSEFGVTPTEIEQHAIAYLRRYRSGDNYDRPPIFPPRPSVSACAFVDAVAWELMGVLDGRGLSIRNYSTK
jgi:NADH dehydrogenase (ubiquinone) 1 alpha subcomplex subunit 9